jgi:hypothetical protein
MAWFTYSCREHGEFKKSLPKRERRQPCPACNMESDAIIKASGSVSIVERLDNGVMARKVERLHNIEEIMSDRADKHSGPQED